MSKPKTKPADFYPHMTDPEGPGTGYVWVTWRWLYGTKPPGQRWWMTMEASEAEARRYADDINDTYDTGPRAFAARIRVT